MSQSLVKIYLHIIFAAFEHTETIPKQHLEEVHSYIGGTIKKHGCMPIIIGGTASHVHVLCEMSNTMTVADLVKQMKGHSSKWIKEKFVGHHNFSWQSGYAAFSVSQSGVEAVKSYIANQAQHHHTRSSREELMAFLEKYHVDYDKKYL